MKKTLLVLASLMVAGVVMAADGGLFTFKSYLSGSNNMKVVGTCGETIASPTWYMALCDANGNVFQGTQGGALGELVPVVASFNGTTGYVTSGGDWSVKGIDQGATASVKFGVFQNAAGNNPAGATYWNYSDPLSIAFGGNALSPPVVAGKADFGGAKVLNVCVPEPSVLALGLLGLGAFLIRRRG